MVELLGAMGLSEDEVVTIVMDNFACGELEAKFIIDLERGRDVSCVVGLDEATPSASGLLRS